MVARPAPRREGGKLRSGDKAAGAGTSGSLARPRSGTRAAAAAAALGEARPGAGPGAGPGSRAGLGRDGTGPAGRAVRAPRLLPCGRAGLVAALPRLGLRSRAGPGGGGRRSRPAGPGSAGPALGRCRPGTPGCAREGRAGPGGPVQASGGTSGPRPGREVLGLVRVLGRPAPSPHLVLFNVRLSRLSASAAFLLPQAREHFLS